MTPTSLVLSRRRRLRSRPDSVLPGLMAGSVIVLQAVLDDFVPNTPVRPREHRCRWCGTPARGRTCGLKCRQQWSLYWQLGDA